MRLNTAGTNRSQCSPCHCITVACSLSFLAPRAQKRGLMLLTTFPSMKYTQSQRACTNSFLCVGAPHSSLLIFLMLFLGESPLGGGRSGGSDPLWTPKKAKKNLEKYFSLKKVSEQSCFDLHTSPWAGVTRVYFPSGKVVRRVSAAGRARSPSLPRSGGPAKTAPSIAASLFRPRGFWWVQHPPADSRPPKSARFHSHPPVAMILFFCDETKVSRG